MSDDDLATTVGRARQAVAVLASPTLRAVVVGDGGPDAVDERTRSAVSAFDWLGDDGRPDQALLGRTAKDLQRLQAPTALLEFDRIERLPASDEQRHPVSVRIVRLVSARLGAARAVPEAVLNAAIAMFCADVAVVRRDAVDLGVLVRTDDGSSYRFTG